MWRRGHHPAKGVGRGCKPKIKRNINNLITFEGDVRDGAFSELQVAFFSTVHAGKMPKCESLSNDTAFRIEASHAAGGAEAARNGVYPDAYLPDTDQGAAQRLTLRDDS
jgi:hypothetical protein